MIERKAMSVRGAVIAGLPTYRHACRLAWKLRNPRISHSTLAEMVPTLYRSHISDYFSVRPVARELPARHIAAVERVLANTVISQWVLAQSGLTVIEQLMADELKGV